MSKPTTSVPRPRARRAARALGVGLAVTATMALTVTAASASSNPAKTSSTTSPALRDCYHPSHPSQPGYNCRVITYLPMNQSVTLICQKQGDYVQDDPYWDYVRTPNNGYGYVADYLLDTYSNFYKVPGVDTCQY